mmetsp:Transcript_28427/g.71222  ORF Transcript_28427/g.71222 Transcript_28427/m.71222 type:complete len:459 (+) Transcript_28427:180-1556(+)
MALDVRATLIQLQDTTRPSGRHSAAAMMRLRVGFAKKNSSPAGSKKVEPLAGSWHTSPRLVVVQLLLILCLASGEGREDWKPRNRPVEPGVLHGTRGGNTLSSSTNVAAAASWQLDWRPGKTAPPRRLVPLRYNYIKPQVCEPWLACVRDHGLQHTLQSTPWPSGASVLFAGNSYVRQLAETAVLDVPDGAIRSMHYPRTRVGEMTWSCQCHLLGNATSGYRNSCEMEDFLSSGGAHRADDGIQYCDSWVYNETAASSNTASMPLYKYCADDAAVVQLYDGGVLAQFINHPAQVLPLDEAVPLATGLPLGAFDVVVANRGNFRAIGRKRWGIWEQCGEVGSVKVPDDSGRRLLPLSDVLSALLRARFRGHLFQVSDTMWEPVHRSVETAIRKATAAGLPFSAHTSSVLHGKQRYEVVRRCGEAKSSDRHACMPGPPLWMTEALRAQYAAALARAGGEP